MVKKTVLKQQKYLIEVEGWTRGEARYMFGANMLQQIRTADILKLYAEKWCLEKVIKDVGRLDTFDRSRRH